MENKDVKVKHWKKEYDGKKIKFTFKKRNKSLFELDDESRKAYKPTLIDYFDSSNTPAERKIFSELIAQNNKMVNRMTEARKRERFSEKKIVQLRKQNKNLLPHVERGRKVLWGAKQAGEARREAYKKLYKLYRVEAGHCREGLSKAAIGRIIANKLERDKERQLPINRFLDEHNFRPLKPDRIARII